MNQPTPEITNKLLCSLNDRTRYFVAGYFSRVAIFFFKPVYCGSMDCGIDKSVLIEWMYISYKDMMNLRYNDRTDKKITRVATKFL